MNEKKHATDAEELYQHRNDPDEWETEEEQIEVRPSRTSVVSFRLPAEEMVQLERAAKDAGQTLSEYIRTAIIMRRVHGNSLMPGTYNVSYGSQFIPQHDKWKTWTTAPKAYAQTENLQAVA